MIVAILKSLITSDMPSVNRTDVRFVTITHSLYQVSLFIHSGYLLLFYYLEVTPLIYLNIVSIIAYSSCIIINRKGMRTTAILVAMIEVMAYITLTAYYIGWESGAYYYIFILIPVLLLHQDIHRFIKFTLITTIVLFYTLIFVHYHDYLYGSFGISPTVIHFINYTTLGICIIILSSIIYYYSQTNNGSLNHPSQTPDSDIDSLTGLLSRPAIKEIIESSAYNNNHERGCSLIIFNIDNFKMLNSRYGLVYGDNVLRHVAALLKKNLRTGDFIARWGNAEFIAYFPDIHRDECTDIINRIRKTIEQSHAIDSRIHHTISITFGICRVDADCIAEECLENAEKALQQEKFDSTDRISVAW